MALSSEGFFGKKVEGVRVVPISLKIVGLFVVFLLLSNFITNFINLTLNRQVQVQLTEEILKRDLVDLYAYASDQFKLYQKTGGDEAVFAKLISESAQGAFRGQKSAALAIREDGSIFMQSGSLEQQKVFPDTAVFKQIKSEFDKSQADPKYKPEGIINFTWGGDSYFGFYRYNSSWQSFFVRAEEMNEFYAPSVRTFVQISLIILGFTLVAVIVGILLINYLLRFVKRITDRIMEMQHDQDMGKVIDMSGAPNDDVSYLGIALNSLSGTITNLLEIFKKFVARDIAKTAYRDREIRLEGRKKELSIIFSDIKSFTYMTETLGEKIVNLLNLHYNNAIRCIHKYEGDVGSIIGDAVLAIFGVNLEAGQNKSLQAIESGYEILAVAESLRKEMEKKRTELLRDRGYLTDAEERVYKAVCLEVGVGIDGGTVFYGNIGSNERMVNTVIGDNVNSASRLEGLTRIYKTPMIVSQYIRDEVSVASTDYFFLELDQVQVKGKTIGKRIFYPVPKKELTKDFQRDLDQYSLGLQSYYQGEWPQAAEYFKQSKLAAAALFLDRFSQNPVAPKEWSGIWTMQEK